MRTLVTGSNGFIGSCLVEALLANGHQVWCLARKTSNLLWLQNLPVEFVYGDLNAADSLEAAVKGMDWIFHLAGLTKARNRQEFFKVNYEGVTHLLTACEKYNPHLKKLIFISSQAAGGPASSKAPKKESDPVNPLSAYGEAKLAAEHAVLRTGDKLPVTIIRPPSVYGPRDTEVLIFFKLAKFKIRPIIGDGQNRVSIVYVSDLVEGILAAAASDQANGKVFYITGDGFYTWNEILIEIAQALGVKTMPIFLPFFVVKIAGFFDRLVSRILKKKPLLSRDKITEIEQRFWLCDNSRAKKEIGFAPRISLHEGIQKTANWYQQHGWL